MLLLHYCLDERKSYVYEKEGEQPKLILHYEHDYEKNGYVWCTNIRVSQMRKIRQLRRQLQHHDMHNRHEVRGIVKQFENCLKGFTTHRLHSLSSRPSSRGGIRKRSVLHLALKMWCGQTTGQSQLYHSVHGKDSKRVFRFWKENAILKKVYSHCQKY